MRFNHLRRRGFIALLGAAAVTMWGCLGVLPGSIFLVVIGTTPAATQQRDLDAINKRFSDLYAAGNYAAALVEAKKAEALVKSRFGAAHANYGSALYNLALVYQSQGKYADAEGLYQRALAITEKAFGADHPDVVWPLNNLALVYVDQGKYADAEGLYKRALAIREKALGAEPPRRGDNPRQPGQRVPRPRQVRRCRGAPQARAGDQGEGARRRPPRRGQDPQQPGPRVPAQGKYADAEALYKRALAIREKALGANHPDVARTLDNLAIVYWAQGKYAEAEGLYKRALAIREKALGARPPRCGHRPSTTWPACTRPRQVRRRRAALQARAGDREKALGADHPDVATALNNLAERVSMTKANTPRPRGSTSARWRSRRRRSAQDHPDVAHDPQQPGRACIGTKASTPTPSRSTSAHWRSGRRRLVQSTLPWH